MRILHVIGRIDFADGGPPMVATRLAAAQAHAGHDVQIVLYASAGFAQAQDQLRLLPHWDKVGVHRLPPPGRAERLLGTAAASALRPLVATADVLHLHNVWEVILLRAAWVARAARKPYVIIVNGMLDPWSLAQKSFKKRAALALGYRRMLDGAAALHVLNEQEKKLIEPLGLKAPMVVIPNGVMLEEIDPLPPRGTFLRSRPELANRRYVLFLSRLHYKKGLDFLADTFALAAPRNPDLQLVVAGPDGGERDRFIQRIAAAGLSERTHLVGPLYGADKFAALVDCDCFILPSRQEGFSLAILEALACKAPVVISQSCNFPEVAAAGAGEVTPLNAIVLAAALERILADPHPQRFGQAGRALVESRYTWDRVAAQTISVYQNALAGGK